MENNSRKQEEENKEQRPNSKRGHPDDTTSSGIEPKTAKIQAPSGTTANNENTNIHIAVTTSNGSDLSQTELETIRTKTEKMYLDFFNDNHDNYPKFVGEAVIDIGVLKLVCKDEFTKEWLQKKICDLKINCAPEKLPLKLVLQKDLPTKTRCGFNLGLNINPNKVQSTLHKMNMQASVDKWSFYNFTKTDNGGLYVEVGIPNELLKSIMEKNDLSIGFQPIKLNIIEEKEKKQATTPNPIVNSNEAGPSGSGRVGNSKDRLERKEVLETEVPRRSHRDGNSSQQRLRTSIIEPITERDEIRRRQSTAGDSNNDDALSAFFRYSRDQALFPEFVKRKCLLAERAIGTTITEQHLVLAFLSGLQEKRITRDLLKRQIPNNLEDLRESIKYYNYCRRCDKIGHLPDKCWSSNE